MATYPNPKNIISTFRIDDYTNFSIQTLRKTGEQANTDLDNNLTADICEIGNSSFANTDDATANLNPKNLKIKCECPIKLPPLYSTNWSQNLLHGMGYQEITLTSFGAANISTTFRVVKFAGIIYLQIPHITVLSTNTSPNTLRYSFASYPELLPSKMVTEGALIYNQSVDNYLVSKKIFDTSLNLTLYGSIGYGPLTYNQVYDLFPSMIVFEASKPTY